MSLSPALSAEYPMQHKEKPCLEKQKWEEEEEEEKDENDLP